MVNKKLRVLIVDDEQVVCDLLYTALGERGYLRTALETEPATDKPSTQMDTIARGVEVKLDPFAAFSRVALKD